MRPAAQGGCNAWGIRGICRTFVERGLNGGLNGGCALVAPIVAPGVAPSPLQVISGFRTAAVSADLDHLAAEEVIHGGLERPLGNHLGLGMGREHGRRIGRTGARRYEPPLAGERVQQRQEHPLRLRPDRQRIKPLRLLIADEHALFPGHADLATDAAIVGLHRRQDALVGVCLVVAALLDDARSRPSRWCKFPDGLRA